MNERALEFKRKLEDLLLELNTPDIRFNVGVFVFDIKGLEGQHFGIGCPGCMAGAVIAAVENGEIKHKLDSQLHKEIIDGTH